MGNQSRCHPGGGGTLTVRHQIDLAVAQAVDVVGQLLATLFAAVHEGHAGGINLCATAFKVPGNGVEVVDQTAKSVEAGYTVYQHNRMTGLGVAGVAQYREHQHENSGHKPDGHGKTHR